MPTKWTFQSIVQMLMLGLALLGVIGAGVGSYVASSIRMAEYDLRITALEHQRDADRKETQEYQLEMRTTVQKAIDLLTDVRLQLAKVKHG